MDRRAALTASRPTSGAVLDRAIYTSVRSPMGSGYKIVGATPGISADERREIVQRAPSHGNLCDASAQARALASFALSSGRWCLFLSRHDGAEPSGRGGLKIRTDALVMCADTFAAYRCDPVQLQSAAREPLDACGDDTANPEPIHVPHHAASHDVAGPPAERDDEAGNESVLQALGALLDGRQVMLLGAPHPERTLHALLAATPIGRRAQLTCAYGLRYSTQRSFDLLLLDADARELAAVTGDERVVVIPWGKNADLPPARCDRWLGFVRKAWRSGRTEQLTQRTDALIDETSPEALNTIAFLQAQFPMLTLLNASAVESLSRIVAAIDPTGPVQRTLIDELSTALARRRKELCTETDVPPLAPATPEIEQTP